MSVSPVLLRTLHRILGQLAELNGRLERGPRQIRIREANVAQLDQALAAAIDASKKTKLAADQKQLELRSSELKIQDLKGKLNMASSNKEFHALQEQIAACEMAGSVLADEILEGFEKADELDEAVVVARKKLEANQTDLARCRDEIAAEAEGIRRDITRLQAELEATEGELPKDFRVDYQRVVRSKGADALAVVEQGVCQGCGQQITLNRQNQLMLSEPVCCTACGRILYTPEP
jgi:predicted  nucleic acid-binding Zn-ribbon protein